jgi:amino acid transporter
LFDCGLPACILEWQNPSSLSLSYRCADENDAPLASATPSGKRGNSSSMLEIDLAGSPRLKRNYLSFAENLAQAVGALAPTAGVALTIQLSFATAGNATWLLYVLVLGAYLLIGINISEFASRTASPGAIYHFSGLALGQIAGLAAGWTYVFGLLFSISSPALVFSHYAIVLCRTIPVLSYIPSAALVFLWIGVLLPCWISCRNVRLSTNLVLILECASIGMMLVLAAVFLVGKSRWVDLPQLKLTGVTWTGFRTGSILALFSMTGFETATALGGESKKALKNIPRALLFSLLPAGLLFIIMSYVMVASFRDSIVPLDKAEAPFEHLAAVCGLPAFGTLIDVGVLLSFFACTLANLNAAARILYAIAQNGHFWPQVGVAHRKNATPHRAILVMGAAVLTVPTVLMLCGMSLDECVENLSELGAFGFFISYLFICFAAPVYLRQKGILRPRHVAAAVACMLVLSIPLASFIYPLPDAPARYFPYLFTAIVIVTTAVSWRFRMQRSRELNDAGA